jgi:exonuclease SbcD
MAKIAIMADAHIGIRYPYRVDVKTGISDRSLDFIESLARVVNYAIKNKIDIIVIAGDLFERVTIGPTILKQVRENIWKPISDARIPIVCIGGNHDSPQILEKGSPLGEISLLPNSIVARIPQTVKVKALHSKEDIGFILLPYMTSSQIVKFVEKRIGREIDKEKQMLMAQEYLKIYLGNEIKHLYTKKKIIVGHFHFQGSKINVIPYPDQLPHEFTFKKDMLPPINKFDLAIFGHIHTTQTLHEGKVLVPGSLERVDFGETSEDKGFYIFDTKRKNLEFISNNPRKLIKQYIDVPKVQDPTNYLIEKLPENVKDAVVRIIVKISRDLKRKIILPRIYQKLSEAFYFEVFWDTSGTEREIILPEFVLDPLVLFNEFIKEKYKQDQNLQALQAKGLEILGRALTQVEEKQ